MKDAPFKVVCINTHSESAQFFHRIKVGEIVEVVDVREINGCGVHYLIAGYETNPKSGNICWYWSGNFAPIDEIEYKDVTKELAVLPTDEVPDVKKIKELVN